MKKVISLLLAALLMLSMTTPAYAAQMDTADLDYGVLPVQIGESDVTQYLSVMYDGSVVYAEVYGLAEALGYGVEEPDDNTIIMSNESDPNSVLFRIVYSCDTAWVDRNFIYPGMIEGYTAPNPSVKNDQGVWVPLHYTILMVGRELRIVKNVVKISSPLPSVEWVAQRLIGQQTRIRFDWNEDFGYTEETLALMSGTSGVVTVFNGCLDMDGASWVAMFQQLIGQNSAYDTKYGEMLTQLMCTSSAQEFETSAELFETVANLFDDKGVLADAADTIQSAGELRLDDFIQQYADEMDAIIQNTDSLGDDSTAQRIREALACCQQYEFDGKKLKEVLGMVDFVGTTADCMAFVMEVGSCVSQFQRQDEFAVAALRAYLEDASGLPEATRDVMIAGTDDLSESLGAYTVPRMLLHGLEEGTEKTVTAFLGAPANVALVAWELAGNAIPWLSDGLKAADQFQLAGYSSMLQADAERAYTQELKAALNGSVTSGEMMDVAKACYVYLKSCYITRQAVEAAMAGEDAPEVLALLNKQRIINDELAAFLSVLKTADAENTGYVLGFLPEDNRVYLDHFDDTDLAALILVEPYASYMDIIAALEAEYGKAEILYGSHNQSSLGGLSYINLVDFDQNGLDELLVAYKYNDDPNYYQWTAEVYTYDVNKQETVKLYEGDTAYGGGVGGDYIFLSRDIGKIYLICGHTIGYGIDYDYYSYENGEFKSVRHVGYREVGEGVYVHEYIYMINGTDVSEEVFKSQEKKWQSDPETFYFAQGVGQTKLDWLQAKKQEILDRGRIFSTN